REDTIGEALWKMRSREVHEHPVLERMKLAGVVTLLELMRRRNLPPATKVSTVLQVPPEVTPDTRLPEVAEKMISSGFRAIPVAKGKALDGIISRSDLVRALVETKALEGVRVRDFMTPNPQAVAENDTVEKAIQIMRSLGERSVPVVDKNRHLKGVVGMKDVVDLFARPKVREQYGEHAGREEKILLEVQSVMRYPPLTVRPDAEDPHDPFPEVQSGRQSIQVLPPRPFHDGPPGLSRPPLRLGSPRGAERTPRDLGKTDSEGEGTPHGGTEARPFNVGSSSRAAP